MLDCDSPQQANGVFDALLRRGVIVRPLAATGLPSCLRISVGKSGENEFLISALGEVREELELHHATSK
jgi:histidinol-phosphate aminotransferase